MRTTLTLDEDVADKLKAEVRRSGRSFKETVNALLRLALNVRRQIAPKDPFTIRARPLGLRPGLNYDKVNELVEQLEGPLHR
ncbi:MAG: DUF2191 domain-containing protein [Armatimonadetes bacterium]|nr:DUF2191 domain-containing protein [Armatimonadota bacterium]